MKDTPQNRISTAAHMLCESPLFAHLPEYTAREVTRISGEVNDESPSYLNIEFRDADAKTSACLYITTSPEGFETDEKGDKYYKQSVHTYTSWPSHGSASPELNARRLAFMTQVNDLAARVSASIDGVVTTLYRTAAELEAERAERERQNAAAKLNRVVLDAICTVNKAMRVNGSRDIPKVLLPGVPNGTSTHSINGKKYELRVYEGFAKVERTA